MCSRAGFDVEAGGYYGIDELVTSAYRALLLGEGGAGRRFLQSLTRPKGLLAGASSALSSPFGHTVCWVLARRRG